MIIEGHDLSQTAQHGAIGPAINEHLPPTWRVNKNRIALSDVEERNGEQPAAIFAQCRIPNAATQYEKGHDRDPNDPCAPAHRESISRENKKTHRRLLIAVCAPTNKIRVSSRPSPSGPVVARPKPNCLGRFAIVFLRIHIVLW